MAYTFQESYDSFGNRKMEAVTAGSSATQSSPFLNFTAGNNRIDNASYEDSGNLKSDGLNNYLYDAENRICAVQQATTGGEAIGYLYAPDGTRLGKANLTSFTCDMTQNGMLTANGLVLNTLYTVGPQGEQLQETDGSFNLKHFNVFWEGKVLGSFSGTSYVQSNWHFSLHDWVGTKRETVNSLGAYSTSTTSGPFGDFQYQSGPGSDPSEHHFTGKERDIESGLDYFPARYYSSNLGRFMSPDDVGGHLEDPQTLTYTVTSETIRSRAPIRAGMTSGKAAKSNQQHVATSRLVKGRMESRSISLSQAQRTQTVTSMRPSSRVPRWAISQWKHCKRRWHRCAYHYRNGNR